MRELYNYCFEMQFGPGSKNDVWGLTGVCLGLGNTTTTRIMVSAPASLEGDVLTTRSGSKYKLVAPLGDKEKIHQEIRECIERGCYERH